MSVERLSVNLNKVALLRNARRTGRPDLATYVGLARGAGADGITLHPRPDERHVRRSDVGLVAREMEGFRPGFELNIEAYPDERLLGIADEVRPEQCTLVPDGPDAFTSEKGWDLDAADLRLLAPVVRRLRDGGARVILFVSPDPSAPAIAADLGADGVEIYTGTFAATHRTPDGEAALRLVAETALRAAGAGLLVHVGHDLDLANIDALVRACPPLREASIGHALTADALLLGFAAAVRLYRQALRQEPS